jgi:hypothetical protein
MVGAAMLVAGGAAVAVVCGAVVGVAVGCAVGAGSVTVGELVGVELGPAEACIGVVACSSDLHPATKLAIAASLSISRREIIPKRGLASRFFSSGICLSIVLLDPFYAVRQGRQ